MSRPLLALVNPAAGGGCCGKLAGPELERLRGAGVDLEVRQTRERGEATEVTRAAWREGYRRFLAVGGDGTSYEIVNGLFPEAAAGDEKPTLAFLPLGTGNSFLRDFTDRGVEYARESLLAGRERTCDVLRLTHAKGTLCYINLLSMGFAADVAALVNRKLKGLGELGYLLGVLTCLARLDRRAFPLRVDGLGELDRRRCLFLSFNNSKFTGGKMMIAPQAATDDGLIEYVRWGPIGRLGLMRNLHTLYDGTHMRHPLAERTAARRIEFQLEGPVDVMVDGESLTLECQALDVLPAALRVMA
ncbi:MAG TPA: diacylglycerol kinase family protein [Terriglobales bacterium]|nr:diacylglycerol kinase family protein [Terriglobales bacterium]